MERIEARRIVLHRALPALVGLVLGWHCILDSDAFWHLMLGRAVLRHHSRVVPEPTALAAWTEPCFVKEWLWDVLTYTLHQLGGLTLVSALPAVFGALIGYRAARLVEYGADGALRPLHTALALLGVCSVAEVLDVRPNLVFFVLLLGSLELALRYSRATERQRVMLAGALVLLQLGWVQLHSSSVLGPLLFIIVVFEARLRDPAGALRPALRLDGLVLLGLLLAITTGSRGLAVTQLVLSHAGGDASRHIQDMRNFDWSRFAPLDWHVPLVVSLLLLLGALGLVLLPRRNWLAGLLLALLGAAMTYTASRFVFVWGLLLLPWAGMGAASLASLADARPLRRVQYAYVLAALLIVGWSVARVDSSIGPLFRLGLRTGDHPQAAARYLAGLPRGTAVFTEYGGGASLGFWLDGHARTFVDSRTMLYFDDTDWAVARDMLASPLALQRGFARYRFGAAVVSRDSGLCPLLAASWSAVVVDAHHTTFVPRQPAAAETTLGLAPCGPHYLAQGACSDRGERLLDSLRQQRRLGPSPFLDLMTIAVQLQCQRGPVDPGRLPPEAECRTFRSHYRLYRAWSLMAAGQTRAAVDAIDRAVEAHDPLAARVLLEPAAGVVSLADAQRLLTRAIAAMDDSAPPALRARLALICQARGDAECARFQGLRALLFGDEAARPAVVWAAEHHQHARVRADLRAWLTTH